MKFIRPILFILSKKVWDFKLSFIWVIFFSFYSSKVSASQEAIVTSPRAIIFSDQEMSSPIGFISQGKKIKIGDTARNKAQVYPIVVSGKIAYIRTRDVSTEMLSLDSGNLTAERFKEAARSGKRSKFVPSYYFFNAIIGRDNQNGQVKDKDSLLWNGIGLKGEELLKKVYDFQLIMNFMQTTFKDETFRALEIGVGGSYRLIDVKKFLARIEAQALAIPYSSYALGSEFRVNGQGFSAGAGLNLGVHFKDHWGLEFYGGPYYTKLFGFNVPSPYSSTSPSFIGIKAGVGLNFMF